MFLCFPLIGTARKFSHPSALPLSLVSRFSFWLSQVRDDHARWANSAVREQKTKTKLAAWHCKVFKKLPSRWSVCWSTLRCQSRDRLILFPVDYAAIECALKVNRKKYVTQFLGEKRVKHLRDCTQKFMTLALTAPFALEFVALVERVILLL